MTSEKELRELVEKAKSHGATVNVKFDDDGYHKEIQVIGLKGMGTFPVTGMIAAAEAMRRAIWTIENS